jgi:hypothetical protein
MAMRVYFVDCKICGKPVELARHFEADIVDDEYPPSWTDEITCRCGITKTYVRDDVKSKEMTKFRTA